MNTASTSHIANSRRPSASIWISRVLSTLMFAFMVFDGAIKFTQMPPVVEAFQLIGYPMHVAPVIGAAALLCAFLYAIPRTAFLGALLFTALCGGAVASHLRIGSPLFSHTLFGVYMSVLAWGALWMREPRLRAMLPFIERA